MRFVNLFLYAFSLSLQTNTKGADGPVEPGPVAPGEHAAPDHPGTQHPAPPLPLQPHHARLRLPRRRRLTHLRSELFKRDVKNHGQKLRTSKWNGP